LKNRQQLAWSSGDYAIVGTTLQIVGEQLCEALDIRAGQKLLDVAGVKSPALWGTRGRLVEMFSLAAISIEAEPRNFNFRYRSADHFLDVFRTYYGVRSSR
jgi:hypothetical protein